MSENLREQEIAAANAEKYLKIKNSLNNIKDKKSKIMFCVPEALNPIASVYEIYFHASVLKKAGYDVTILTEKPEQIAPYWIEPEITSIPHIFMEQVNVSVSPEDVIIIPEIFSNLMEQTKNLPCIRIGFLQSIDYMVNGLIPGVDWSIFGIQNIITTSETMRNIIDNYYGRGKFNIKTYNIGIPDYFKKNDAIQRPVISLISRNPNDISKVVKLFYAKYPQYSFVSFDAMTTESNPPQPLRRVDFADRLKKNFAAVWIDRIASFGTFPLECMKAGVIPIALKPDITPEYLLEKNENGELQYVQNAGAWTDDIYALPLVIGDVVTKYLDNVITDDLYESMEAISNKYNQEDAAKQILENYEAFLNERVVVFENAVNEYESKKQTDNE